MLKSPSVTVTRNYKRGVSQESLRVLVVFAHPDEDSSFNAAILKSVLAALKESGHAIRVLSVATGEFSPVLSKQELKTMYSQPAGSPDLQEHVNGLKWANAIIFIYPTWWSSVPAALKGWIDRVFVPGVAYTPPTCGSDSSISPLLNIKKIAVITTTGGPCDQQPDLGVMLLTETIPSGCCVSRDVDILVIKLHSVVSAAKYAASHLTNVYSEMRNF